MLELTKLCGFLGSKGRWVYVAADCVSSGQKRKAAPTAMRILTLGSHSSSSPSYKPVMTSRKLPRDLRRMIFKAPREGPPTTPGQEITSTGMSSRFRLTDKGCGLSWASMSSRNAFRACWAGESLESRAASLGNLFCLFWGTGRGAL